MLNLYLSEVEDTYVQENFKRVIDFFRKEAIVNGNFRFFEFRVPSATTFKFRHNLGFVPKDVLLLSATGGVQPVWNYDNFDKEFVEVVTTGATTIRAFIGRYEEPRV